MKQTKLKEQNPTPLKTNHLGTIIQVNTSSLSRSKHIRSLPPRPNRLACALLAQNNKITKAVNQSIASNFIISNTEHNDILFPEQDIKLQQNLYRIDELDCFIAQLSPEQKNVISHCEINAFPLSNIFLDQLNRFLICGEEPKPPLSFPDAPVKNILKKQDILLKSIINHPKRPMRTGDYISFTPIQKTEIQSWVEGKFKPGHILKHNQYSLFFTESRPIKNYIKSVMTQSIYKPDGLIICRIKNGSAGLSLKMTSSNNNTSCATIQYIYCPNFRFKIVGYSIAIPKTTTDFYRIAVELEEVSTIEHSTITTLSATERSKVNEQTSGYKYGQQAISQCKSKINKREKMTDGITTNINNKKFFYRHEVSEYKTKIKPKKSSLTKLTTSPSNTATDEPSLSGIKQAITELETILSSLNATGYTPVSAINQTKNKSNEDSLNTTFVESNNKIDNPFLMLDEMIDKLDPTLFLQDTSVKQKSKICVSGIDQTRIAPQHMSLKPTNSISNQTGRTPLAGIKQAIVELEKKLGHS